MPFKSVESNSVAIHWVSAQMETYGRNSDERYDGRRDQAWDGAAEVGAGVGDHRAEEYPGLSAA